MNAVLPSLVAVLGTLAGAVLGGMLQIRTAATARQEARRDARWAEALAAVTALVSALADHRRAMSVLEGRKFAGAEADAIAGAVAESHTTRAAVTAPLTTLAILAPALAQPARDAAQATYAMRNSAAPDVLEARRAVALAASNKLVDAAADLFAAHGNVVEVSS